MKATIVGAGNMGRSIGTREVAGQQLDVLVAGDDEGAKQRVAQLASDVAHGAPGEGRGRRTGRCGT
jgi:predicted dinucleotide-binding enzyme